MAASARPRCRVARGKAYDISGFVGAIRELRAATRNETSEAVASSRNADRRLPERHSTPRTQRTPRIPCVPGVLSVKGFSWLFLIWGPTRWRGAGHLNLPQSSWEVQ